MISVPVVEAKNKLTFLIRMLENNIQDIIEITKHGKSVAVLGKKDDFKPRQQENSYMRAYQNFRSKIKSELSLSEWEESFNIPRSKENIRHSEDFE